MKKLAKITKIISFIIGGFFVTGIVYAVTTQTFQNPVPIANGGTNATTSAAGLANLGGISTSSISINGTAGNVFTGLSTSTAMSTTTKTIYDQNATSTDYPNFVINAPAAFTIKSVSCYNDNQAGNSVSFNVAASTTVTTGLTLASSSLLFAAAQTCNATSSISTNTTFANASILAGQSVWLVITSASTTGFHVELQY